jgi:hypothetical protein
MRETASMRRAPLHGGLGKLPAERHPVDEVSVVVNLTLVGTSLFGAAMANAGRWRTDAMRYRRLDIRIAEVMCSPSSQVPVTGGLTSLHAFQDRDCVRCKSEGERADDTKAVAMAESA